MDTQLSQIFTLMLAFQVKHYLADFPLQRKFMFEKKSSPGWDFMGPLAAHSAVHAVLSLAIISFVNMSLWWLALVDFAIHFLMDRIKAGPKYLGRFNDPSRATYWNCFGFDQLVHHLTNYFLIWYIVTS